MTTSNLAHTDVERQPCPGSAVLTNSSNFIKKNKRKGRDFEASNQFAVVSRVSAGRDAAVFINENEKSETFEATREQLAAVLDCLKESSSLCLDSLAFPENTDNNNGGKHLEVNVEDNFRSTLLQSPEMEEKVEKEKKQEEERSSKLQKQIQDRIENELQTQEKESEEIYQLQLKYTELQTKCDDVMQEVQDADDQVHDLQDKIALAKEEADDELDSTRSIEEDIKIQASRLVHQVSLYSSMTGIKWHYDDDQILAGEVAIPSQERVDLFSFDPDEMNRCEIASHLWKLIEGNEMA